MAVLSNKGPSQKPCNSLSKTEAAYIAGLFDGEGSAYVARDYRSTTSCPRVTIVQCDKRPLLWILEVTGCGGIYTYPGTGLGKKEKSQWMVTGKVALDFLEEIEGYVIVKQEEVEGVLSHYER